MKARNFLAGLAVMFISASQVSAQCIVTARPTNPGANCYYAIEQVVWADQVNVQVAGQTLTKNAGSNNSWDAGAASTSFVYDEGFARTVLRETNRDRFFGLSSSNAGNGEAGIEYAFNARNNSTLRIYESGVDIGSVGSYATDDTLRIEVDNSVVKYYKNSVLLYVSTVAPSLPLLVDVSIEDLGGTIDEAEIGNGTDESFTADLITPGTGPSYQWFLNGAAVATGQVYTPASLSEGDEIYVDATPGASGCGAGTFTSNLVTIELRDISTFGKFYVIGTPASSACKVATEEAYFTGAENMAVDGNTLEKIQGGNNSWNSGAYTENLVEDNGYVEFVAAENTDDKMVGLSNDFGGSGFTSIDFALNLQNDGDIKIFENGVDLGDVGDYVPSDVFRVAVEDGIVHYYQNGNILYISLQTPTLPLLTDFSFEDIGAKITDVEISNGNTGTFTVAATNDGTTPSYQWQLNGVDLGGETGASYTNTALTTGDIITCVITPDLSGCSGAPFTSSPVTITDIAEANFGTFYVEATSSSSACKVATEEVVFTNIVNLFIDGNDVLKGQGGNNTWTAGANTLNTVKDNGYVEFTAVETNDDKMVGLSNDAGGSGFSSIDYAFNLQNDGDIKIFENGVDLGDVGDYSINDVFRISVEDGVVHYYQNGNILYVSLQVPTLPLLMDLSFEDEGAEIANVEISNSHTGEFTAITSNAGLNPSYQWQLNGVNVGGETNSTYTNTSLSTGDIVTCIVTPDLGGCSGVAYTSSPVTITDLPTPTFGTFYVENTAAADACKEAIEEVVFTNVVNLFVSGNNLVKGQGGNNTWTAGANSLNTVKDNGYMEFTAPERLDDKMVGLSNTAGGSGFGSINFALNLQNDGDIKIYENGVDLGDVGDYVANDVFRITVEDGVVHYYQNGNLLYISLQAPTLPLLADVSFEDEGAAINDMIISNGNTGQFSAIVTDAGTNPSYQWQLNGLDLGGETASTYTNTSLSSGDVITCVVTPDLGGCSDVPYTSNPVTVTDIAEATFGTFYIENTADPNACKEAVEEVVFVNNVNIFVSGNSLLKGQGGNNTWTAGTNSLNTVKDNGYMEFTAAESGDDKMIGISNDAGGTGFTSIDFALNLQNDGDIKVYENGVDLGNVGNYVANDVFRISVEDGVVHYYQNGNLLYISLQVPTLPLLADVSFEDEGAAINDMIISNGNTGQFSAIVTDAGASPSYQWQLNGLDLGGETASTYTNTSLSSGDVITCVVTPDLGGCSDVSYTSNPVTVTDIAEATFGTFYIENTADPNACKEAVEEVVFVNNVNIFVSGNSLLKAQGGNNTWTAGTNSLNTVKDNGYLEFTAAESGDDKMVGLSNTAGGTGFTSIDFALNLQNDGDIKVYENGVDLGDVGNYVAGDVFRISVEDGVVHYYQNGNLLYISLQAPTLPLLADVSFEDEGAAINDVIISNGNTGQFSAIVTDAGASPSYQWQLNGLDLGGETASTYTNTSLSSGDVITCVVTPDLGGCSDVSYTSNPVTVIDIAEATFGTFYVENTAATNACKEAVEEVVFTNNINIFVSGNSLLKAQGGNNTWTAGTNSLNTVKDNGYLEFTAAESGDDKMVGLSNTAGGTGFTSIDFALNLQNDGDIKIYENGVDLGDVGDYAANDVFRITVEDGVVHYYQNNTLLYISLQTPTLPLLVDVSFEDEGAAINDVIVSNGNTGVFSAIATNAGVNPGYQWQLNGIDLGGETSATYTNTALNSGDVVTCVITPDLGGCSNVSYTSNPVTVNDIPDTRFGEFFIENFASPNACLEAVEDVTFENIVNIFVNGNSVIKGQGGNNTWTAGANSLNSVKENGYVVFSPGDTIRDKMIGISNDLGGTGFSSIDYAFNLQNDRDIKIFENGVDLGNVGTYTIGDELRITVENGVVNYYQNGILLYVSQNAPTFPLYVDLSLEDEGATINDIRIVNGNTGVFTAFTTNAGTSPSYQWQLNGIDEPGEVGSTYTNTMLTDTDVVTVQIMPDYGGCGNVTYTSAQVEIDGITDAEFETFYITNNPATEVVPVAFEQIRWRDEVNLFVSGNTVIKGQGGNNSWNAGAFSENTVSNYSYAQTVITEASTDKAFGLSDADAGVGFNGIDYKFFLQNDTDIFIFEGSNNRGNFGNYAVNDTMKIAVVDNTVEYYQNSTLLYTSTITPTLPLHVDVSINDQGGEFSEVQIVSLTDGNFTANLTDAGSDPQYQWKLNGADVGSDSPNYSNNLLVDGDIITVSVIPDFGGCDATSGFPSNEILIREFNNILPVELLSFEASNTQNGVELTWSTATELNNEKFILEKSTDGESYAFVTEVAGAGTSNIVNTYRHMDLGFNSDVTYYRLKQQDFDGTVVVLDIVRVEPSLFRSIRLKNNPVFNGVIELDGNTEQITFARLLAKDGRIVGTFDDPSGELPIGGLQTGIYVLEIYTEEGGRLVIRVAVKQ